MRIKQLIIHSNLSKTKFSQLVFKETTEAVQENSAIHYISGVFAGAERVNYFVCFLQFGFF